MCFLLFLVECFQIIIMENGEIAKNIKDAVSCGSFVPLTVGKLMFVVGMEL